MADHTIATHAHHFTDCRADMLEIYGNHDVKQNLRLLAAAIADFIETGERFYYPSGDGPISGKIFTDDIKAIARLPFELICVYSGKIQGNADSADVMYFAMSRTFHAARFKHVSVENFTFATIKAVKLASVGRWDVGALGANCWMQPGIDGIRVRWTRFDDAETLDTAMMEEAATIQSCDILNLCVMLNLHNVKSVALPVSKRLNVKRQRSGKLPLYSYKVLKVDGITWDRHETTGGVGVGYRCHMRRGHIRRLDETRRCWVRATMVHGSQPGFVDKEYAVGNA